MRSEDRESYTTARPYTCHNCGVAMRTRGADGLCYRCLVAPAVRCARCLRVRYEAGGPWEDHPGKLPREVEGTCRTCGDLAAQERAKQRAREDRRLLRDRAKGYGPGTGDPFAGFREEGR